MKLVFGFLIGVMLGGVCGVSLVYFNPLISTAAPPRVAGTTSALRYSLEGPHLLASTHNEVLPLPVVPERTPLVWESGVRGSLLQVLVLEDGTGVPGGIATRLSVPSTRSNGLTAGLITDDQWLITVPGRGILYARGRSNVWPVLKDTILNVDMLGRDWAGPRRYAMSDGQPGSGARIVGLTGELAGYGGALTEVIQIDDYPGVGLRSLKAEVRLDFEAPAPLETVVQN